MAIKNNKVKKASVVTKWRNIIFFFRQFLLRMFAMLSIYRKRHSDYHINGNISNEKCTVGSSMGKLYKETLIWCIFCWWSSFKIHKNLVVSKYGTSKLPKTILIDSSQASKIELIHHIANLFGNWIFATSAHSPCYYIVGQFYHPWPWRVREIRVTYGNYMMTKKHRHPSQWDMMRYMYYKVCYHDGTIAGQKSIRTWWT